MMTENEFFDKFQGYNNDLLDFHNALEEMTQFNVQKLGILHMSILAKIIDYSFNSISEMYLDFTDRKEDLDFFHRAYKRLHELEDEQDPDEWDGEYIYNQLLSEFSLTESELEKLLDISFKEKGMKVLYDKVEFELEKRMNTDVENHEVIETSQPLDINLKVRVAIAHKIGLLDFLANHQSFSTSIFLRAKVLGVLMGANPTTIQSYLNPIYSQGTSQKNNPLIDEKIINKAKLSLSSLGYIDLGST